MRILVTGVSGQLGAEVQRQGLAAGHEVVASTRSHMDLGALRTACTLPGAINAVVNCAAYTNVDQAEAEREAAMQVNAEAPRWLAHACREQGCKLVQISTDYVFGQDAARREPYGEDDATGPVNVYGESKLAGEQHVRAECPSHFVVRTCGLYGHAGKGNFVKTMLRLAEGGGPLRVVDDQACTPTNVRDVAAVVLRLIGTDAFGTYHVTNEGACSWFEFACEIMRLAGQTIDVQPIATAEFPRPAARPTYSVLGHGRLTRLGVSMRRWPDALAEYVSSL